MDKELKKIKKLFGEKFAQWCRDKFPTILNYDGELLEILLKLFHPTKTLWEEIAERQGLQDALEEHIYVEFYKMHPQEKDETVVVKTPEELCDEAGYELIKCETVEDVERFKKYYLPDEELCTFNDVEWRLEQCVVFFAVRKDVDEIERGNPPKRDDEYGTSVMSLQFDKTTGRLSIKNRYNHTVIDCDATLDNNLENIAPGLTKSFETHYGIKENQEEKRLEIDGTVKDDEGRIYFYNYEIDGVYYCEDNVVIKDGKPTQYSSQEYELIDYFLYDKNNETIIDLTASNNPRKQDGFVGTFANIDKVEIVKGEDGNRIFKGTNKDGTTFEFAVDRRNRIISYQNNNITQCPSRFMEKCRYLKEIELENVESLEEGCFTNTRDLEKLVMPNVRTIKNKCLENMGKLTEINFENLESIGNDCFQYCRNVRQINLPVLKTMGNFCFVNAGKVSKINVPSLVTMGDDCFKSVQELITLDLPILEKMGSHCFQTARWLDSLNAPKLKEMGDNCFYIAENIERINAPLLEVMGEFCFNSCEYLKTLNLPSLVKMGNGCFFHNLSMSSFQADKLVYMGERCFYNNKALSSLTLPSLEQMGNECFCNNDNIKQLNLPKLILMGIRCFYSNGAIVNLQLPRLEIMGDYCFYNNMRIENISAEKLMMIGKGCFRIVDIKELVLPNLVIMWGENFQSCWLLQKLELPRLVTMGHDCFVEATKLTELDLPNALTIGDNCFRECEALTKVSLPSITTVQGISFKNCPKLKKILLESKNAKVSGLVAYESKGAKITFADELANDKSTSSDADDDDGDELD